MTGQDTTTGTPGNAAHGEFTDGTDDQRPDTAFDHEKARAGARLLLEAMGEDPMSDTLKETWERRVPAMLETLSEGTRRADKPTMRTFDSESQNLVIKTGIEFQSLCEHHLLPYTGTVHVAYRPNGSVVGLSKLIRYVRWQSRQPTKQEDLTRKIANGLAAELDSNAVLVELTATHLCEVMRGVESETITITRATAGDPTTAERSRFDETIIRTTDSHE